MKLNITLVKLVFVSVLLSVFTSCKKESNKVVAPLEITFKKEGELKILQAETDSVIATFDIEIADDDYQRQTGLMHRESMKPNQAMLFIFPDSQYRSFFMKNTLIGLDILYLDENKKLISAVENAKPLDETSLPSTAPAKYVLEINAGQLKNLGIEVNDRIKYTLINN